MTTRRLIHVVAAALAAVAVSAPTAMAMPDRPLSPHATDSAITRLASTPETVTVPGPTVVVQGSESSGFDWGSAAIGAGATGALVILVSIGGFAHATRHRVQATP